MDAGRRRRAETELRGLVHRLAPEATIYFPRKRRYHVGLSWNGRHLRPTGLTLESQLHEVAHLLLSPPERRALPEFGLGPDPYRRNDVPCVIPRADADREELHACWLQLLLARLLSLDEAAVRCEFQLPPLSASMVQALAREHPDALPASWWQRAHETTSDVRETDGAEPTPRLARDRARGSAAPDGPPSLRGD